MRFEIYIPLRYARFFEYRADKLAPASMLPHTRTYIFNIHILIKIEFPFAVYIRESPRKKEKNFSPNHRALHSAAYITKERLSLPGIPSKNTRLSARTNQNFSLPPYSSASLRKHFLR